MKRDKPAINSSKKKAESITNRITILLVLERPMVVCLRHRADEAMEEAKMSQPGAGRVDGKLKTDGSKMMQKRHEARRKIRRK